MSEYTKKAKIDRLNHQFKRLSGKIYYMNKLTNMGRKFGRNAPCPCRSGEKFKKCCIVNHVYNTKKLSQLQVAMGKLRSKLDRNNLKMGSDILDELRYR